MKLCERCSSELPENRKKERFCKQCAKAVVDELKDAGYLKAAPKNVSTRSRDMTEDTYETKRGGNR